MRSRQGAVLQSLRRVRAFLDAHDARLGLSGTETRKALDETVAQLTEQAVIQDRGARGSRGETAKQRSVRYALRLYHMRPIAEIAQLHLHDVPEFASLRMPDTSAGVERLLAAANAMADAARPHEQTLITNGLSSAFLVRLETAIEAMRVSIDERGGHRQRRAGATAGLVMTTRRGRALLKVLDGLVLFEAGADEQLAAEWRAARRVFRVAGSSSSDERAPTPLITPTTQIAA